MCKRSCSVVCSCQKSQFCSVISSGTEIWKENKKWKSLSQIPSPPQVLPTSVWPCMRRGFQALVSCQVCRLPFQSVQRLSRSHFQCEFLGNWSFSWGKPIVLSLSSLPIWKKIPNQNPKPPNQTTGGPKVLEILVGPSFGCSIKWSFHDAVSMVMKTEI